jgi:ribonuclease R
MTKKKLITGTVKRNPDGFGFLIPEKPDHPDVYLPRHTMEGVMTSDKVLVQVEPERDGNRFRGEIVKVVERGFKKIVGPYTILNDKFGMIKDEGKGWGADLKIKIEDSLGAKPGQLVAAQIDSYPENNKQFLGKVVEVIGASADPLNDIRRVLLINNIPSEFPSSVLKEASLFSEDVSEQDMAHRRDLRSLSFITIDGATAKDFDDAVYCETNFNGFLLYVAIADVSHYVQVGTEIDKEAYTRGTSVYYPNFVTPMLPEVLSNGLCSLVPQKPRLALVAEMQLDFNGQFVSSQFYEAVIESKARVTYGEAQEIIEGNPVPDKKHVTEEIKRCADLAKVLMAKRFREGSLDLEIPETQLMIDASGVPIDVIRSERLFSHRVIEEMMLAANVAVAKFLSDREVDALYRIHEEPKTDAIAVLDKYLTTFGGRIKLNQGKLQKRLTKALEEFDGKPEAQVLHILTLRSMAQAKYSPHNVGHFGLGFEFYTHFTSPIRRYPDLIVHRLIKNQIMPNSKYRLMSLDDLETAGTMLSACEQRAVKSERQLMGIKKARYMEKFLGQEFDGMVSSVVKFGIFVLLRGVEVDGLIRLDDLGPERYEFDEDNLKLVAKRSGHSYSIGDTVKVTVDAVDIEAGQVNFRLAGVAKKADSIASPYRIHGVTEKPKFRDQGAKRGSKTEPKKANVVARYEKSDAKQEEKREVSRKPGLSKNFKDRFKRKPKHEKTQGDNGTSKASGSASFAKSAPSRPVAEKTSSSSKPVAKTGKTLLEHLEERKKNQKSDGQVKKPRR